MLYYYVSVNIDAWLVISAVAKAEPVILKTNTDRCENTHAVILHLV